MRASMNGVPPVIIHLRLRFSLLTIYCGVPPWLWKPLNLSKSRFDKSVGLMPRLDWLLLSLPATSSCLARWAPQGVTNWWKMLQSWNLWTHINYIWWNQLKSRIHIMIYCNMIYLSRVGLRLYHLDCNVGNPTGWVCPATLDSEET